MSYEYHNENQCDKCDEEVGISNLHPVSFLYKDMNDVAHKDMGDGYRQYFVCMACEMMEDRIRKNRILERRK